MPWHLKLEEFPLKDKKNIKLILFYTLAQKLLAKEDEPVKGQSGPRHTVKLELLGIGRAGHRVVQRLVHSLAKLC
jgi:hypothetical protein